MWWKLVSFEEKLFILNVICLHFHFAKSIKRIQHRHFNHWIWEIDEKSNEKKSRFILLFLKSLFVLDYKGLKLKSVEFEQVFLIRIRDDTSNSSIYSFPRQKVFSYIFYNFSSERMDPAKILFLSIISLYFTWFRRMIILCTFKLYSILRFPLYYTKSLTTAERQTCRSQI